jgi:fructose/tagatose bisphosphate aldolase
VLRKWTGGRLAEITAVSDRPISLHGASGLGREELRRAVGAGVAKVNFNTVMRQRWIAAVTGATEEARDGARMLGIQAAIAAAARDFVTETIGALTVPSTGIPPRSPVTSD